MIVAVGETGVFDGTGVNVDVEGGVKVGTVVAVGGKDVNVEVDV